MAYLWGLLKGAVPMIVHGDPYLFGLVWVALGLFLILSTAGVLRTRLPS